MIVTEHRSGAAEPASGAPPGSGPRRLLRPAAVALALCLALAATAAARSPYAEGEQVVVTGVVTDSDGKPLPDLQVTLEASRAQFNVRRMGRERGVASRLAATTNAKGEYALVWPWHDYYNRFDVVVSVPVRRPDGEHPHELARADVTKRIDQGSPVVVPMTVEDVELVERRRDFLAALDSEDERKVYQQMGLPDRSQRVALPRGEDVTWWYFHYGRAYRFRDGVLAQVIPFDPVEPF